MADVAAPTPDNDQQPPQQPEIAADASLSEAPAEAVVAAAEAVAAAAEAAEVRTAEEPEAAETVSEAAAEAVSPTDVAPTEVAPVEAAQVQEAPVQEEAVVSAAALTEPEPVAAGVVPAEPVITPSEAPLAMPTVASTIEVPASAPGGQTSGEGGEWELLVEKLRQWIGSGQLQEQWQASRTPLSLLAGLIALLLVLRLYGALLAVIDSLPLLPGLLELAGLIAVVQFSLTRLVRSEERRSLIQSLQQRWKSFRGQG
jgi:cobalamin biosynthesis Mg chelatase CobN